MRGRPPRRLSACRQSHAGSSDRSNTTRGATRRSSPRCRGANPTVGRAPNGGSAPTRTARRASPTAPNCARSPAICRTCSRCSPRPNPSRCRPIPPPTRPSTGIAEACTRTPAPSPNCCARSPGSRRCAACGRSRRPSPSCDELGATATADLVERDGPGAVLRALYRGDVAPAEVVEACGGSERPEAVWVNRLHDRYPNDASVAATILLNHVVLAPGEAIHLTAGNLHAYLHGAGIELMGASDNVVRGGLTVKPVDVDELLRVVDPTPAAAADHGRRRGDRPLPAPRSRLHAGQARRRRPRTPRRATSSPSASTARPGTSPPAPPSPPPPRPTSSSRTDRIPVCVEISERPGARKS